MHFTQRRKTASIVALAMAAILGSAESARAEQTTTQHLALLFGGARPLTDADLSRLQGAGVSDHAPTVPTDGANAIILWDELKRAPAPTRSGVSSPANGGAGSTRITVISR